MTTRLARAPSPQKFILLMAMFAIVAGILVLLGWKLSIDVLKSIIPGWSPMKVGTAFNFVLAGIALLLSTRMHTTSDPHRGLQLARLVRIICSLIAAISIISFYEYFSGFDLGLERWLSLAPVGTPDRMAPETALCFTLLALAIAGSSLARKSTTSILVSVNAGLCVIALALAAMQSYLTPSLGSFGWLGLPIMAMNSAALMSMLGAASIAATWQAEVLPWSLNNRSTVSLACAMVLLVFIGLNITRTQYWMKETTQQIEYDENILRMIESLQLMLSNSQTQARSYYITHEQQHLADYRQSKQDYLSQMESLRQLAQPNTIQKYSSSTDATNLDWLQHWSQEFFATPLPGKGETATEQINRSGLVLERILLVLEQLKKERQTQIDMLKNDLARVGQLAYSITAAGTLSSLLIFLTVTFRFNSAVNKRKLTAKQLQQSKKFFQSLIENVPVRIFWKDRQSRYLGCNVQFANDVGIAAPADIVGKVDADLLSPEQAALYVAADKAVMDSGIPKLNYEEQRVNRDGRTYHLHTSKIPLLDETGATIGILGTYQDITAMKISEEKLRASEERYRSLFENMLGGYAYCKMLYEQNVPTDFIYLNVNAEFGKMTGLKDVIGKRVTEVIPDIRESNPELFEIYGRVAMSGIPEKFESHVPNLNIWFAVTAYSQQKEYFVAVFDNITERKRDEMRLKEQLDELHRWQNTTMGRETRTLELKHEVNQLLAESGQPPRYPSAEQGIE